MTRHLSVTQIVQLTECPSQFHFDNIDGAARSDELTQMAAAGERAHTDYEKALERDPSPLAGDPARKSGWLVRLIRWVFRTLFGRR